jgi:hypothetical protein
MLKKMDEFHPKNKARKRYCISNEKRNCECLKQKLLLFLHSSSLIRLQGSTSLMHVPLKKPIRLASQMFFYP